MSAGALGGGRGGAGVAPVLSRAETVEVLLEAARQVSSLAGHVGGLKSVLCCGFSCSGTVWFCSR